METPCWLAGHLPPCPEKKSTPFGNPTPLGQGRGEAALFVGTFSDSCLRDMLRAHPSTLRGLEIFLKTDNESTPLVPSKVEYDGNLLQSWYLGQSDQEGASGVLSGHLEIQDSPPKEGK